jgi:ABC-type sugar transport system ATPase subunit
VSSVRLDSVTKRFGDAVAVDDLDLDVRDGELLVLLGPSGCGKSTALRLVAGLEQPDRGSVRIGDRDVTGVDGRDRDVAMVFQSYALYPHLTVRRNIEFPLRARKVPEAERASLVAEAARQLGLDELLERKPRALSGGERQRVALARAIVRRPAVFLLDEPLSNLDAQLRTSTRAELVDLHRRLGTTFVHVTHDQVEAMTMATRIAVLDRGRLQQVGRPQEVYDRPANAFVARFVGTPPMNVIDGASALTGSPEPGVLVGVRPEHVHLGAGGAAVVVRAVEALGHEHLVVTATERGEEVVARVGLGSAVPPVGERTTAGTEPAHVQRFDPSSGERLDR